MRRRYTAVYEWAGRNYAAHLPEVVGCVTTGPTLEETRRLLREAVEFHFEGLIDDGLTAPSPSLRPEDVMGLAAHDVAEWLEVEVPAPAVV